MDEERGGATILAESAASRIDVEKCHWILHCDGYSGGDGGIYREGLKLNLDRAVGGDEEDMVIIGFLEQHNEGESSKIAIF